MERFWAALAVLAGEALAGFAAAAPVVTPESSEACDRPN